MFNAHWLSETSPRNTRAFWPWAILANARIPAMHKTVIRFITTPKSCLRQHGKFQMHAFMVLTADHRADGLVLSRFGWSGQQKFLRAWLEQEVPALDLASIFGPQQGQAVDGTISVPRFAAPRGDAEEHRLAGSHSDLGGPLAGDLVAAVPVGRQFDEPGLRSGVGKDRQKKSGGGD